MKIVSVVGARPEFVQCVPVSQAIRVNHAEILVHTGQHYDYRMSQSFFDELGIPAPDYNLEVGSGSHGKQTAEILVKLEEVLITEKPDLIIIRGDTNSTLAGALAAAKLSIPIVHIEAGERSFMRRMPEEINRLVSDRLADLHLCASHTAMQHLEAEGIPGSVFVGDVMFDVCLRTQAMANHKSDIMRRLSLSPKGYALVTLHRAATTDDPRLLGQVVAGLNQVEEPIIFPLHLRTKKAIEAAGLTLGEHICGIEPVGYFDMFTLETNARLIATDSGGVQREAYFMEVPCLTLRDETEWTETITAGWNCLVGTQTEKIKTAWHNFSPATSHPLIFGDGHAGENIAAAINARFH
jgi:UDP-GlcNAc3NAcA epimerase